MKRVTRKPGRPPIAHPRPTISVRLSPAHLAKLEAAAAASGTTRTALIQIAISRYLKENG